jgi:hypothetical protein
MFSGHSLRVRFIEEDTVSLLLQLLPVQLPKTRRFGELKDQQVVGVLLAASGVRVNYQLRVSALPSLPTRVYQNFQPSGHVRS